MGKFLKRSVLFFLLLAGFFGLGLMIPPGYLSKENYHLGIQDKHTLLEKESELQRLVIVGGSSVALGLYSPMLKEQLNVQPINTGINSAYGLKYCMADVKPFIREGDVVLLMPEYYNFYGDVLNGDWALIYSLDAMPSNLSELDHKQARKALDLVPRYSVKKYAALFKKWMGKEKVEPVYRLSGFNEYGDITSHWGREPIFSIAAKLDGDFNPEAVSSISDFERFVEGKGARLFVSYPAFNQSSFDKNKEKLEKIDSLLRRNELAILGEPSDFVFPDNLHFDSEYHLLEDGQRKRTTMAIEALKPFLSKQ